MRSALRAFLLAGCAAGAWHSQASGAPAHLWSQRFGDASNQYGTSVKTDGAGNVIVAGTFSGTVNLGTGSLVSAGGNDVFVVKFSPLGFPLWSRRFGDANDQFLQCLTMDGSGNAILTGYFTGAVDFGGGSLASAGSEDVFLAKLDPSGNHTWSKRFGNGSPQYGNSVTSDASGDVLLTGQFLGAIDFGGGSLASAGFADIFVAKFGAAGAHVWSKAFGNAADARGFSVTADAASNVVISGGFQGGVDFGGGVLTSAGAWDAFVAKFDPAGVHQWSKRFGDTADQYANAVAADASSNVVLTGLLDGTADFGGGPLTTAGSYDAFVVKFDAAGAHQWSRRFGDPDLQWAQALATDAGGNVVITGYFLGTTDFGGGALTSSGGQDVFAARFDAAGVHQWSWAAGDAKDQLGFSVAADASANVVFTGSMNGSANFGGGPLQSVGGEDVFVARLDAAGSHQWSRRFGEDGNQYGTSIKTDGAGNVIVAGTFSGSVNFGTGTLVSVGGNDVFVAKFTAAGFPVWSRRFGDAADQFLQCLATDGSGNVILTGYFSGAIDFGGGPLAGAGSADVFLAALDASGSHLWSKRFGDFDSQYGNSVTADVGGNVLVTGQFYGSIDFGGGPVASAGEADIFVAKFDAAGAHVWSKTFGNGADARGFSVAADAAGNVVIGGGFEGSVDFGGGSLTSGGFWDAFVAKFDAAGVHQWSKRFGDAADQYVNAVATDVNGNVVLTGLLDGTADFGGGPLTTAGSYDAFIAKFDAAGVHQWSRNFGDAGFQWAQALATDAGGNVAITGYFFGTTDFGGGALTSSGGQDIFVALFNVAGVHEWSRSFGDASDQQGNSVATGSNDELVLTGSMGGTVDFGGGLLNGTGAQDIFVVRFGGVATDVSETPGIGTVSIAAYPNPFNPQATIQYTIPSRGHVRVEIFEASGARVCSLVDATMEAGVYRRSWNGSSAGGGMVSSGIYFARVTHPSGTSSYRMVLLK